MVDNMLPAFLWLRYFIDVQGFEVKEEVMYQDNPSAIILKNNGRFSSGNCKKHVRVTYFLIKDKVAMGDLKVKYCPMIFLILPIYQNIARG